MEFQNLFRALKRTADVLPSVRLSSQSADRCPFHRLFLNRIFGIEKSDGRWDVRPSAAASLFSSSATASLLRCVHRMPGLPPLRAQVFGFGGKLFACDSISWIIPAHGRLRRPAVALRKMRKNRSRLFRMRCNQPCYPAVRLVAGSCMPHPSPAASPEGICECLSSPIGAYVPVGI